MRRFFYILGFILVTCSFVQGQKVRLEVSNLQPQVGEYITVQMTSTIGSNFKMNFPDEFQSGMNVMSGMRQDYINGRSNTIYYQTLSGFFTAPGVFNLGPVELRSRKKKYLSKKVKVNVGNQGDLKSGQKRQVEPSKSMPPVFAETNCSENKIYRGQSVLLKASVYSKKEFSSIRNYSPYVIDLKTESINYRPKKELDWEPKKFEGQQYLQLLFEEKVIYPQEIGPMNISPFEMVLSGYGNYVVRSKPSRVEVLALPELNQPSSFSGLVGRFEITSSISDTVANVNEILSLTLKITGVGNLQNTIAPSIVLPEGIELYADPIETKSYKISASGYKGSVVYTYPLRVLKNNKIEFPSTMISYFDPVGESYISIETNTKTVNIGLQNDTLSAYSTETSNAATQNNQEDKSSKTADDTALNVKSRLLFFLIIGLISGIWGFIQIRKKRKNRASLRNNEFSIPSKQVVSHSLKVALDPGLETALVLSKMEQCLLSYCSYVLAQDTLKLSRNEIYLLLGNYLSQESLQEIQILFSSLDSIRFGNNLSEVPFKALKINFKQTLDNLLS